MTSSGLNLGLDTIIWSQTCMHLGCTYACCPHDMQEKLSPWATGQDVEVHHILEVSNVQDWEGHTWEFKLPILEALQATRHISHTGTQTSAKSLVFKAWQFHFFELESHFIQRWKDQSQKGHFDEKQSEGRGAWQFGLHLSNGQQVLERIQIRFALLCPAPKFL